MLLEDPEYREPLGELETAEPLELQDRRESRESEVQPGPEETRDQRDQVDQQENKESVGKPAQLVIQDPEEIRDPEEMQEPRDRLALEELLGHWELQAEVVHPDQLVELVRLVLLDLEDLMEDRAQPDVQEQLVPVDQEVLMVAMVRLVPQEKLVQEV